jgi:biopolymer transport protein ExbB/TolQ
MPAKKTCIFIISIFFLSIVTTWAIEQQSETILRRRARTYRPLRYSDEYETTKEREERLRRWEKADEARIALDEMKKAQLEKSTARSLERKERTKGQAGQKERNAITRLRDLEQKVVELEKRVNLLEDIITNEVPDFSALPSLTDPNIDPNKNSENF